VPETLRGIILGRLERLSEPARKLLAAGAVIGSRFVPELACAIADLPESVGVSALEEAGRHLLLREEGRSCLFAHDKVAEVVYFDLGAARRRLLHRRALATLEQAGGAPSADLARHALEAEAWELAYRYSVQAGVAALQVGALRDAISFHEQALRLTTDQPSRDVLFATLSSDEVDRLATFLGNVYFEAGDHDKQRAIYDAMVAAARASGNRARLIVTLVRVGQMLVNDGDELAEARVALDEALRLAEEIDNVELIARASRQYGKLLARLNNCRMALAQGQRAVDISRAVTEIEPLATSLLVLGDTATDAGDWELVGAAAEECFPLFVAAAQALQTGVTAAPPAPLADVSGSALAQNAALLLSAPPTTEGYLIRQKGAASLMLLGIAQIHRGELAPALDSFRVSRHIFQERHDVAYHTRAQLWWTLGLLERGIYDEALQSAREANAMACTVPLPRYVQLHTWCLLAAVHLALLELQEARAALDQAHVLIERVPPALQVMPLALLCVNYVLGGDWADAATTALEASVRREAASAPLLWLDFARSSEVEALLRAGHIGIAQEDIHRLNERVGSSRRYRLVHLRMRAALERWEGHLSQALATLQEAGALAADIGLPAESWQVDAEMARIFALRGDEEQCRAAREHAESTITLLSEQIADPARCAAFVGSAHGRLHH
jgi:tetratricopeptide (TPR) repeat protein